jgi:hypothetical protein
MTTNDKLNAKIEAQTTEALLEIATRLNLVCTTEAIIICNRVDRELERRLSGPEFAAHLQAMEAMLDAAA